MKIKAIGILAFSLTACVGAEYDISAYETLDDATTKQHALQQQITAYHQANARRQRVYDLTWPLLTANTELCYKTRHSYGLVIADRDVMKKFVHGIQEKTLAEMGVPRKAFIFHSHQHQKLDGLVIEKINGETVTIADDALKKLNKKLSKLAKGKKPITLTVSAEKDYKLGTDETLSRTKPGFHDPKMPPVSLPYDVTLNPVEICDIPVKISSSPVMNAHADRKKMVIYKGLIDALDDSALQFVIAHEMAHVNLRHVNKTLRNLAVSGAPIYGPPMVIAGRIADNIKNMTDPDNPNSASQAVRKTIAPYSRSFEAEADYVGLYYMARTIEVEKKSGIDLTELQRPRLSTDINDAAKGFEIFGTYHPKTTWQSHTHPTSAARVAYMQKIVHEIDAKIDNGEALMPNKRNEN